MSPEALWAAGGLVTLVMGVGGWLAHQLSAVRASLEASASNGGAVAARADASERVTRAEMERMRAELRHEMATEYVHREEWVREMAVIGAKMERQRELITEVLLEVRGNRA